MYLTFTSSEKSNSIMHLHHPEKFVGNELKEYCHCVRGASGKCTIKETVFEGVSLFSTIVESKNACIINVKCSRFCWLMNFVLEGSISINLNPGVNLLHGQYLTYHSASLNTDMVADRSVRIFTVCLTHEFVSKFLSAGVLNSAAVIHNIAVTEPRTNAIITALQVANVPGSSLRIYLESKVLELLSIQIERTVKDVPPANGLSKQDVERLQEAKIILTKNMQNPCSLMELARRTGLNDFKLKRGFKILFGNTVFGYLFQLRMETACNLLQNSKSVSEVAEAIGYKNPHHFTAAFKKRYGFLPSQLNKMSA